MNQFELLGKTFKVVPDNAAEHPCDSCAFQKDSPRCSAVHAVTGHDCIQDKHHYVEVTDENV